MEIIVNNMPAALKSGSSFDFIFENRLFSGSDGYSLTITFPLRGCAQNLAIFGHINRADVESNRVVFDSTIRDRTFVVYGSLTITEINEIEVKTQFLEGRSEANFNSTFDDIYINELDLGSPSVTSPADITPSQAWNNGALNLSFVALPWVNNASGNIQNDVVYENNAYSWHPNTQMLSWQPYLIHVVRQICNAVGYSINLSAWDEKEEHRYLLMCNTLPATWDMPNFAHALPHWTVKEFFEKLELLLEGEFDIDHRARHIEFRYSADVIASLPMEHVVDIIDEHSVQISEDERCEYREAKNLTYSQCEHNMWKFYSCDWFARSVSRVEYNTLAELLANNREWSIWNGSSYRGTNLNKVLHAKDLDISFVIRSVEKNLAQAFDDFPNRYEYKCVLQPINLFGNRIVDEDPEADVVEVEFVPAWVDFTDTNHGRCLFLESSGFDEATNADSYATGGIEEFKRRNDDWWAQPHPVQWLENGEKEQTNEFFDRIYIGWWDGAVAQLGKLPYPYTDDVVINEDWSNYFRPHTSLRINKANRNIPQIDKSQKIVFKFLTDKMPSSRSIFLIRGKRYVCEKLTATFTENGISKLVKGEFWRLKI